MERKFSVCVDLSEMVFAHNNTRCAYTERCVNQLERANRTLISKITDPSRCINYRIVENEIS